MRQIGRARWLPIVLAAAAFVLPVLPSARAFPGSGSAGDVPFATLATPPVLYVPASAHAGGANGADWRTDLEIHNAGTTATTATIALLVRDAANPSPQTRSVAVAAGASVRLPDVLLNTFGFTGAAALRVTSSSDRLVVTSRTYNLVGPGAAGLPQGASFGQFVRGVSEESAIPYGQEGRLIQLTQRDASSGLDFRTNVGFVNLTSSTLEIRIDLFGADGTFLGTRSGDETRLEGLRVPPAHGGHEAVRHDRRRLRRAPHDDAGRPLPGVRHRHRQPPFGRPRLRSRRGDDPRRRPHADSGAHGDSDPDARADGHSDAHGALGSPAEPRPLPAGDVARLHRRELSRPGAATTRAAACPSSPTIYTAYFQFVILNSGQATATGPIQFELSIDGAPAGAATFANDGGIEPSSGYILHVALRGRHLRGKPHPDDHAPTRPRRSRRRTRETTPAAPRRRGRRVPPSSQGSHRATREGQRRSRPRSPCA